MAKIINLLDKAIEAKKRFKEKHEKNTRVGGRTVCIFICHLFHDEEWENVVGPHMESQFNYGSNNIASHIHLVTGTDEYSAEQYKIVDRVTDYVRFKWLNDLVNVAVEYGDDAILPDIASNDVIKHLYNQFKQESNKGK